MHAVAAYSHRVPLPCASPPSLDRSATANKPSWILRWLGADIAPESFCGYAIVDRPELLHIAAGTATGGGAMYRTRLLTSHGASHRQIVIKEDCFLANEPLVLAGATMEAHTTMGNRSVAMPLVTYDGGVWSGAPAKELYRRDAPMVGDVPKVDATQAFRLLVWPLGVSLFIMILQSSYLAAMGLALSALVEITPWLSIVLLVVEPWLYVLLALAMAYVAKAVLKGSFQEGQPDELGSVGSAMRTLVTSVLGELEALIEPLKGTPLFNIVLRLLGARVGDDVIYLGRMVPEADVLHLGDRTVVGPEADMFTHNFENLRFTYEPIAIGDDCSLGERSSIMGHTQMRDQSRLLPLAQGMKGVELHSGRSYGGNPADVMPLAAGSTAALSKPAAQQGETSDTREGDGCKQDAVDWEEMGLARNDDTEGATRAPKQQWSGAFLGARNWVLAALVAVLIGGGIGLSLVLIPKAASAPRLDAAAAAAAATTASRHPPLPSPQQHSAQIDELSLTAPSPPGTGLRHERHASPPPAAAARREIVSAPREEALALLRSRRRGMDEARKRRAALRQEALLPVKLNVVASAGADHLEAHL